MTSKLLPLMLIWRVNRNGEQRDLVQTGGARRRRSREDSAHNPGLPSLLRALQINDLTSLVVMLKSLS